MADREPVGVVYAVRNIVNNKIYVGQTKRSPGKRWKSHVMHAKHPGAKTVSVLGYAIRKYGENNFRFVVLLSCYSIKELDFWEKKLIAAWKTQDPRYGYNIHGGGSGDNLRTPEQRKAASKAARERCRGGNRNSATKLSDEAVSAISVDSRPNYILAKEYGVSRPTITAIRNGTRWSHVPRPEIPLIVRKFNARAKAKLTEEQVVAIRHDPRLNFVIAEDYGVSGTQVGRIKSRLSWSHVND